MPQPACVLFVLDADRALPLQETVEREHEACTTLTAGTLKQARAHLESETVECIVAEQALPDGTGLELLAEVRQRDATLPFILVDEAAEAQTARAAVEHRATDYLPEALEGGTQTLVLERIQELVRAQRQQRHTRELERVDALIREIDRLLAHATSREELYQEACRILAGAETYAFAWIGEVDETVDLVRPVASAGVDPSYLDEVVVSTREEPTGEGPTGRAARTRQLAVMQDIMNDPSYEPWREAALERGFRSSVAIPLVFGDALYAILNVYSDRPFAFEPNEQRLLQDLARSIAHALHAIDVTDELRASRSRLSVILETAPDGLVILQDGEIRYANERAAEMGGWTLDEMLGAPLPRFIAEEDHAAAMTAYQHQLAGEAEQARYAFTLVGKQGQPFPAEIQVAAFEYEGQPAVLASIRDISERLEHERQLERYADIMSHLPVGVYRGTFGAEGRILEANAAMAEILGAESVEDIVGREFVEFYANPEERVPFSKRLAEHEIVSNQEIEIETLDGQQRWILVTAIKREATDPDGTPYYDGILHDITERKQREQELQALTAEYETVFENTQDALFLIDVDPDGTLRYSRWNEVEEHLAGMETEEIQGKTPVEALGEHPGREVEARYRRCLEAKAPVTYEEVLDLTGGKRHWQTRLTPVIVDGEVTEIVGAARDITQMKTYEARLERQRDQLEILNRLIRHDIRNDMSAVVGLGEMLLEELDEEQQAELKPILETGQHVVDLTQTARDLVEMILSGGEIEVGAVDLEPAIREEVTNAARRYPGASFSIADGVPDVTVRGNVLLTAVFRNILNNAVQHNDKETPQVEVSAEAGEDAVTVRIADNGPGIPDSIKETLFERTSEELSESEASIGLYLVATLVHHYDGAIHVEDNDPEGTVVVVELVSAD